MTLSQRLLPKPAPKVSPWVLRAQANQLPVKDLTFSDASKGLVLISRFNWPAKA